jgi:hypothetical protein
MNSPKFRFNAAISEANCLISAHPKLYSSIYPPTPFQSSCFNKKYTIPSVIITEEPFPKTTQRTDDKDFQKDCEVISVSSKTPVKNTRKRPRREHVEDK